MILTSIPTMTSRLRTGVTEWDKPGEAEYVCVYVYMYVCACVCVYSNINRAEYVCLVMCFVYCG